MEIPGITQRGVQRLARRDINAPLREGQAEAQVAEAVGSLGTAAIGVGEDMYNSFVDHRVRKADSEHRLGIEDFKKNIGTQEFFDPNDIPEGVEYNRNETIDGVETQRSNIPAWEVYPQMLDKYIKQSTEDKALTIPEARIAQKWGRQVELEGAQAVTTAQGKAVADWDKETKRMSANSVNQYLAEGMWDEAVDAASNYPGSAAEQTNLVDATKAKVVTGKQNGELELYYGVLSMDEDANQLYHINESLDILQGEDYKGNIVDEDKRFRIIELLKRKRKDLSNQATNRHKLNEKRLLRDIRQATEANNKGLRVDAKHMFSLQDQANAVGLHGDPTHYDVMEGFRESWEFGREVNKFLYNNPLIQQNKLGRMKGRAKTGIQLLQYDKFAKASGEYQKNLSSDAITTAESIGMVSLVPIDFADITGSLAARAISTDIVQDKTGFFTGYLTKDEAAQFSDLINKAPSAERGGLIANISDALGPDSYKFYDQLDLKKAVPSFVMAGRQAADGLQLSSDLILRGSDILKEYPTIIKNASLDMDPQIEEALGSAYWQDPTSRSAVKGAVHNIYAALSAEEQDYSGDVVSNSDRLNKAIELATGGISVINETSVETPAGTTPEVFESWVTNLSPKYIKAIGTPANFSASQVTDGLANGDISLVSTFRRGQYNLLYAKEGKLLFGNNGRPYTLGYEQNAPMRPNTSWFSGVTKVKDIKGYQETKDLNGMGS